MDFLSAIGDPLLALKFPGITGGITPPPNVPTGGLFNSIGQEAIRQGLSFFLIIVLLLAILYATLGAIRYIFARGDKEKIQGAREKITYSIVGLIVAFLAFLLVGLFSSFVNVPFISKIAILPPTPAPTGAPKCPAPPGFFCTTDSSTVIRGDWNKLLSDPGNYNYQLIACPLGISPNLVSCTKADGVTNGNFDHVKNLSPGTTYDLYVRVENNTVICTSPGNWSNKSQCITTGAVATPTPIPTLGPTATPIPTSTPIPTPTLGPTATPIPTSTPTPTPTLTPTPTNTPTPTPTPTPIPCALSDSDGSGYPETCKDSSGPNNSIKTFKDYCDKPGQKSGIVVHAYVCDFNTQLCVDNTAADCSLSGKVCVVEPNGQPICKTLTNTVNGFVWVDAGGDGVKGSEPGFVGAEIKAIRLLDNTIAAITFVADEASAYFEFLGLDVGEYKISLKIPAGFKISPGSIINECSSGQCSVNVDITGGPANVYDAFKAFGIVSL